MIIDQIQIHKALFDEYGLLLDYTESLSGIPKHRIQEYKVNDPAFDMVLDYATTLGLIKSKLLPHNAKEYVIGTQEETCDYSAWAKYHHPNIIKMAKLTCYLAVYHIALEQQAKIQQTLKERLDEIRNY